jgi:hypothetical protein
LLELDQLGVLNQILIQNALRGDLVRAKVDVARSGVEDVDALRHEHGAAGFAVNHEGARLLDLAMDHEAVVENQDMAISVHCPHQQGAQGQSEQGQEATGSHR